MSRTKLLTEITDRYESEYRKRTPKSHAAHTNATKYLPGGENRAVNYFSPYPVWIEKANGCKLIDVDGNEYIDFHNNFSSMILGYNNPKVTAALMNQLEKGVAPFGNTPTVLRWAEIMCQRVESVDKIRFVNSGSEAVMFAIRAARAFTGKNKILMTDGGFHGSYDVALFPSHPDGLSKSLQTDSIIIPYNDNKATEKAIIENKNELAAVIVEGHMGAAGQIPPKNGYLNLLREVTAANNVLLILDEVMCFRLDYGGVQGMYGIKPDLTTFGKIIGGGFPVGAFGGREDVMNLFSPQTGKVFQSGTFSGNPMTATAGVTSLEQITAKEIDRINQLGESMAVGIRKVCANLNIKAQVTGYGSMYCLHFSSEPIIDGKTSREANQDLKRLLHLALMVKGIPLPLRGQFSITTPMTKYDIEIAIKAIEDALSELKPSIERLWPELIQ
jgi:glutamate-1-semialdehyde 2,1-aminomutase